MDGLPGSIQDRHRLDPFGPSRDLRQSQGAFEWTNWLDGRKLAARCPRLTEMVR
jgi:hypothetical protein